VVFVHPFLMDGSLWTSVTQRLTEQGIRTYAPDWPLGAHRTPMKPDADLASWRCQNDRLVLGRA
jgi:pimeloyl-ACP methyl ester carboxylesterase